MIINNKIGIATVFYNPNILSIELFKSLADHGYVVAIANNGIGQDDLNLISQHKNITIVGTGINIGLAKGMNDAINSILENNIKIEAIALFDQDSKPDIILPELLYKSYNENYVALNLACIGPILIDEKISLNRIHKLKTLSEVTTIATSGTLISRKNYKKVGPLKDDFFIDCIDHEWCFRAKSMGLKVYVDNKIEMKHNMGEAGIDWFGTYKPIYRSPVRHYYIVRNTLAMLRTQYVPMRWKAVEVLKLIRRIVFYIIFSDNRVKTFKNIFQAFSDGLTGKMGVKN